MLIFTVGGPGISRAACSAVNVKSSICLAAYNGSAFIAEQIRSILSQMGPDDEIIVVDDRSTDNTTDIVRSFDDDRICLFSNAKNLGVNANFEAAINRATGDIIFMSDQDDIWLPGRLDLMKESLLSGKASVVASNFRLVDAAARPLDLQWCPDLKVEFDHQPVSNFFGIMRGTRNYFGCTMAFRSELRTKLLPFPIGMESHDLWVAIYGIVDGGLKHIEEATLLHRIHGANASIISRSFSQKLYSRIQFMAQLLVAIWRACASPRSTYRSVMDTR